MSVATKKEAHDRIKIATEHSKIAVFYNPKNDVIRVLFASTVRTQQIINDCHDNYLGSFFGHSGAAEFVKKLNEAR